MLRFMGLKESDTTEQLNLTETEHVLCNSIYVIVFIFLDENFTFGNAKSINYCSLYHKLKS